MRYYCILFDSFYFIFKQKTTTSHNSNSTKKASPTDDSIVRKLMLDSWNRSIFMNVKERLQESAMKLIQAERNGEAFDSQLVIGR